MCLNAGAMGRQDAESETLIPTFGGGFDDVAHTLRADGFDASEDGTGRGTPLVPVACVETMPTMLNGANTPAGHMARSGHSKDSYIVPMAVGVDGYNGTLTGDIAATMGTRGSSETASGPQVMHAMAVRRLTPIECERLQGFPDDYTAIPWRGKDVESCPDGPRYKALGNSMAVPVMRWIGERIAAVAAQSELEAAA